MSETVAGDAAAKQAAAAPTGKPTYERDEFLSSYYAFCQATERLFQEVLVIRKLPVDTYELWAAVRNQGGHQQVQQRKLWAATARAFNHPKSWTNASHYFRTTYEAAGLAALEDLVDSGRFCNINHSVEQQQQHTSGLHPMTNSSTAADDRQYHTGPAVPIQRQQQQQHGVTTSHTSSQDDMQQQSSSLISSGSGLGGVLQQQKTNPYAAMRLAVRCGTARGIFDIPRQRATCYCGQCVSAAGPAGVEMMPTEFERHGGCGSFKKWKKSIIVEDTGRNIGVWLQQHGVVIMSPSAITKKVKKRQLEDTLTANRASGNYHGAARAAAGMAAAAAAAAVPDFGGSRILQDVHAAMTAGGSLYPPHHHRQQQQQQHSFEPHTVPAAASTEHPLQYRRVARTSSSASRQLHYTYQQYSHSKHLAHPLLEGSWDAAHSTLNPIPDRSGSGFSHHRPASPGCSVGQNLSEHASGITSQHRLDDFGLVGSRIRVWWPLDREWYSATVQAYSPHLQLHMLLYDDGDLEHLNLAEVLWEVVAAPAAAAAAIHVPALHTQMAGSPNSVGTQQPPGKVHTSARGTAACARRTPAVTADIDLPGMKQAVQLPKYDCVAHKQCSPDGGSTSEEDAASDAEWFAAAEAAAAARPLRVMWDSHAGLMRVIAAADLLVAEQEMRRQHGHLLRQQKKLKQRHAAAPGYSGADMFCRGPTAAVSTGCSGADMFCRGPVAAVSTFAAPALEARAQGTAASVDIAAAAAGLGSCVSQRPTQVLYDGHVKQPTAAATAAVNSNVKQHLSSPEQRCNPGLADVLPHASSGAAPHTGAAIEAAVQDVGHAAGAVQAPGMANDHPAVSHDATPHHMCISTGHVETRQHSRRPWQPLVAKQPAGAGWLHLQAAARLHQANARQPQAWGTGYMAAPLPDTQGLTAATQPGGIIQQGQQWDPCHAAERVNCVGDGKLHGSQFEQHKQKHWVPLHQQPCSEPERRSAPEARRGSQPDHAVQLLPPLVQQHEGWGSGDAAGRHRAPGAAGGEQHHPEAMQQQQQAWGSAQQAWGSACCADRSHHVECDGDDDNHDTNRQQDHATVRGGIRSIAEWQMRVLRSHHSMDYAVLAFLHGYNIHNVRIKAWDDGRLLIKAAKPCSRAAADAGTTQPGGATRSTAAAVGDAAEAGQPGNQVPSSVGEIEHGCEGGAGAQHLDVVEKMLQLPGRIDSKRARAVMTEDGQLYVQVAAVHGVQGL